MNYTKLKIILASIFTVNVLVFGLLYLFDRSPVLAVKRINPITVTTPTRNPEFKFAIYGPPDDPFDNPMAVLVTGNKIYVSSTNKGKIMVFSLDGRYLHSIGGPGSGAGQLTSPYGLAYDRDRLYVADTAVGKIAVFTPDGVFKGYFPVASGQLLGPAGLAIRDDRLYITDLRRMKILVFDLKGRLQAEYGSEGNGNGQFSYPHGIQLSDEGRIYVADAGNNRVQVINQGNYEQLSPDQDQKQKLITPRGLAFDQRGRLFVVNGLAGKIKVFDPQGQFSFEFGSVGDQHGQFDLPNGIFIEKDGRVYITETGSNRVSVFQI